MFFEFVLYLVRSCECFFEYVHDPIKPLQHGTQLCFQMFFHQSILRKRQQCLFPLKYHSNCYSIVDFSKNLKVPNCFCEGQVLGHMGMKRQRIRVRIGVQNKMVGYSSLLYEKCFLKSKWQHECHVHVEHHLYAGCISIAQFILLGQ